MGKWTRDRVRFKATTVADVAGAACLTVGAAVIYPPAGWITAGALILAASWAKGAS